MGGKRRYPADPTHPDFPHGTLHGYNFYGCRCDRCRTAVARAKKRSQYRRDMGRIGPTDLVDATAALAKIRTLAERYSYVQIGRMTGLSGRYVGQIVTGDHVPAKMTAAKVRSIMAAEDPDRDDRYVPLSLYAQRVYSLCAMGYPIAWIAEQLGVANISVLYDTGKHRTQGRVFLTTFQPLDALYQRIGHIPAERHPAHAFKSHAISIAKTAARKRGYHPPLCYDDYGNLIPGSVRNETLEARMAARDRLARERLDVLRRTLRAEESANIIANRTGLHIKKVERIRKEAGLRFKSVTVRSALDDAAVAKLVVRPECRERAAEILSILDEYETDPLADPFELARRLGLMHADRYDFDRAAKDVA
jgi:hypothetical protein